MWMYGKRTMVEFIEYVVAAEGCSSRIFRERRTWKVLASEIHCRLSNPTNSETMNHELSFSYEYHHGKPSMLVSNIIWWLSINKDHGLASESLLFKRAGVFFALAI
jgi:hypothetical protein